MAAAPQRIQPTLFEYECDINRNVEIIKVMQMRPAYMHSMHTKFTVLIKDTHMQEDLTCFGVFDEAVLWWTDEPNQQVLPGCVEV